MKHVLIFALLALAGCTPYAGFIMGNSTDEGFYYTPSGQDIREDGASAIAFMGVSRRMNDHLLIACQGTHFSTVHHNPEVAINHVGCGFIIQ